MLVGVAALAIIVGLASTRWSTVSALVALVVPTVAVILVSADVLGALAHRAAAAQ